MWIVNFFRELKAWRVVHKVCKTNSDELWKHGFKFDWFGKIYKVVNRDVNIKLGSTEDAILFRQDMEEIQDVLKKLNIIDILAFESIDLNDVVKVGDDEVVNGYMFVFTPASNLDRQYVTVKSVCALIFGTLAVIGGIIALVLCL